MKETGDKQAAKLKQKVKADLPKSSSKVSASVPPPTMRRDDIAKRTHMPSIPLLQVDL